MYYMYILYTSSCVSICTFVPANLRLLVCVSDGESAQAVETLLPRMLTYADVC
jgi:hypothetical protein